MKALDESGVRELRLLTHRLACSGLLERRPQTLERAGFVAKVHALKAAAVSGEWPVIRSLAESTGAASRELVARSLAVLADASTFRQDLQALQRLVEGPVDARIDSANHVVAIAVELHDAHVGLSLDAVRADSIAAFHEALAHDLTVGHPGTVEMEIARNQSNVWALCDSVYGCLVSGQVGAARGALEVALFESVPLAHASARLAGFLVGSAAAPFSGDEGGPRLWAARSALAAYTVTRSALACFALASALRRLLATEPQGLVQEARACTWRRIEPTGKRVKISEVLAAPAEHDGATCEVEGLVVEARHEAVGGKRNTFLKVRSLTDADGQTLTARAHFVNLPTRGVVTGSYVRFVGTCRGRADWNGNAPGIDIGRGSFAESASWIDRQLHRAAPTYALYPEQVLIEWSPVPRGGESDLGMVSDLVFAQELRFLDVDEEEG